MYTEEPRRVIDWNSVIRKGLLIVIIALIIFLIIWLFAKNNRNKTTVNFDNGNNTTINEKAKNNEPTNVDKKSEEEHKEYTPLNETLYSDSFITNYNYINSSAKEYLTTNDLPKNGESTKLSVQELINKGIILPSASYNATDSYVMLTNNNGTYILTTFLISGTEVAKTEQEIKCNKICTSTNDCPVIIDEVEYAYEYEFRQSYKDAKNSYVCPSGYTLTGTKCVKGDNTTKNTTKTVTYSCPSGYTQNGTGENMTCTKGSKSEVNANKTTKYSCADGYTLVGEKCIKSNNVTDTKNASKLTTYNCNGLTGYTLSGTKCVKEDSATDTKNASKVTTYNCNGLTGYTLSGTKCVKEDSITDSKDASKVTKTTYNCNKYGSDYKLSGTKCVKTYTATDSKDATKVTSYSCSDGATPNSNHYCPRTVLDYYKCGSGENLNNGYCRIINTAAHYDHYYQNKGKTYAGCTYSGTHVETCTTYAGCTRTVYDYYCSATYKNVAANPVYKKLYDKIATTKTTYNCNKYGSDYKLSGTKCIKTYTATDSKDATKVTNTTYNCNSLSGYTLSGTKCVKTTKNTLSKNANVVNTYNCNNLSGYTLSGTKCVKTTKNTLSKNANVVNTYNCNNLSGYTLSGTKCVKTTKTTDSINANVTITYNCANGTLNNNKCIIDGTSTISPIKYITYSCEEGYSKVGLGSTSYCTKNITSTIDATISTSSVTKYRYKWSNLTSIDGWERTGNFRKTQVKKAVTKDSDVLTKDDDLKEIDYLK